MSGLWLWARNEHTYPQPLPCLAPHVQGGSHQWHLLSRILICSLSLPPDVDNGYYTVKFDSLLLREAVVEGDGILPPLRTEATESDSDSDGTGDSSYARGMAAAAEPRSQEGGVTLRGSWLVRAPTI